MSVHEAITKHSKKQHEHLAQFERLDAERERLIQEALNRCLRDEPFTTDAINQVTARIVEHAKHGISPLRQFVTVEMVQEYADRIKLENA